jgi:type IV pilus assembly protein PilV
MNKNRESGFSLVEVLISMIVISIGLLGAAGMQLTSMQTVQHSAHQAFATQLAADMANQIRANHTASSKDEQTPYLSLDYKAGNPIIAPNVQCMSAQENCNTTELANFFIHEWQKKISENLPQGRVLVCRDVKPWDRSVNRYKWECNDGENGNTPIVIKLGWHEKKINQGQQVDEEKNNPPLVALVVGL